MARMFRTWVSGRCVPMRRKLQMIFQDPYASLDPRQRVKDIVIEPRRAQAGRTLSRKALEEEAMALLARVGLNAEQANRYPASVFRWPAAAHRHRPGALGASEADHRR